MSANVNNKQNFAAWSIFTVASFSGYFLDGVECYMEIRSKMVKRKVCKGQVVHTVSQSLSFGIYSKLENSPKKIHALVG